MLATRDNFFTSWIFSISPHLISIALIQPLNQPLHGIKHLPFLQPPGSPFHNNWNLILTYSSLCQCLAEAQGSYQPGDAGSDFQGVVEIVTAGRPAGSGEESGKLFRVDLGGACFEGDDVAEG